MQPSSISLPDPPPYPSTVFLTPLGSTLYGNPFSPIYPDTTPLFGSNPLVGSSFSFPQQACSFQPTLNPWSSSHTVYNPQPVHATVGNTSHLLSSNVSSSFSTISISTSTTPILLSQLFLTLLNLVQIVFQEGGSPGVGKGGGVEATPITPPGNLIPNPLFSTPHFPAVLPFLPQTLLSLDISDIFVLMVPLIFLPNPKLPTIPLKELWLILTSSQTSLSLRSFLQWLPLMNPLNMSEIRSP